MARSCRDRGARVVRVGLNGGDYIDWGITAQPGPYVAWRGRESDFFDFIHDFFREQQITDLVIYNDARPYHRLALAAARALNIRTHVLEEGYLRAGYITYERHGVNGWSPLADLDTQSPDFLSLPLAGRIPPGVPMGSQWRYIWAGCFYYLWVWLLRPLYPFAKGHRPMSLWREALSWWPRLISYPWRLPFRARAMRAAEAKAGQYDLVLLQLGADSQMRCHSPYQAMWDFLRQVIETFALDAAQHDRVLVIKTHPLELGTEMLGWRTHRLVRALGLDARVIYVDGGKLHALLAGARSVLTINSTAGQQALQLGLPVFAAGRSIFGAEGLAQTCDMRGFLRDPKAPVPDTLARYQYLLLRGCQVPGGYYHRVAQAAAVAGCVARLFDDRDPIHRVGLAAIPSKALVRSVAINAQAACASSSAQAEPYSEARQNKAVGT